MTRRRVLLRVASSHASGISDAVLAFGEAEGPRQKGPDRRLCGRRAQVARKRAEVRCRLGDSRPPGPRAWPRAEFFSTHVPHPPQRHGSRQTGRSQHLCPRLNAPRVPIRMFSREQNRRTDTDDSWRQGQERPPSGASTAEGQHGSSQRGVLLAPARRDRGPPAALLPQAQPLCGMFEKYGSPAATVSRLHLRTLALNFLGDGPTQASVP